jgi:hypothetical protein
MDPLCGHGQTGEPRLVLRKTLLGRHAMAQRAGPRWAEPCRRLVLGAHQVLCHRPVRVSQHDTSRQAHGRTGHHGRHDMELQVERRPGPAREIREQNPEHAQRPGSLPEASSPRQAPWGANWVSPRKAPLPGFPRWPIAQGLPSPRMDSPGTEAHRVGVHVLGQVQVLCYRLRHVAHAHSPGATSAGRAGQGGHVLHPRDRRPRGENPAGESREEDGSRPAAFPHQPVSTPSPWQRHQKAQATAPSDPAPKSASRIEVPRIHQPPEPQGATTTQVPSQVRPSVATLSRGFQMLQWLSQESWEPGEFEMEGSATVW